MLPWRKGPKNWDRYKKLLELLSVQAQREDEAVYFSYRRVLYCYNREENQNLTEKFNYLKRKVWSFLSAKIFVHGDLRYND